MKVILHNEPNAENNAMLQALYSRSPKSVEDHIERLAKSGSSNFMSQYYVGYGHASIGELGYVTLYLEGISMLAAKAIEDFGLFTGQECSSRYIDFSTQPFFNPYPDGTEAYKIAESIFNRLRKFYVDTLPKQIEVIRTSASVGQIMTSAEETIFDKAVKAAAFDVMRGYLPAGATTNVAWTTNLRKADERVRLLMHHPLEEVRDIAFKAYVVLAESYPASFRTNYYGVAKQEGDDRVFRLFQLEGPDVAYRQGDFQQFYSLAGNFHMYKALPDYEAAHGFTKIDSNLQGCSNSRPIIGRGTSIPRHDPAYLDDYDFNFKLDFGSFRDIHRHRNGYCSNPILTTDLGMHEFYINNLPADNSVQDAYRELFFNYGIQSAYDELINADKYGKTCASLVSVGNDDISEVSTRAYAQYILPMGCQVPVHYRCDIAQAAYIAELRSAQTVHPTLRTIAQQIGQTLRQLGYKVNVDNEPSKFTIKRGRQDISARGFGRALL